MNSVTCCVLRCLHEERLRIRPQEEAQSRPGLEESLQRLGVDPDRHTGELRHEVEGRTSATEEDRQADHALVANGSDLGAEAFDISATIEIILLFGK